MKPDLEIDPLLETTVLSGLYGDLHYTITPPANPASRASAPQSLDHEARGRVRWCVTKERHERGECIAEGAEHSIEAARRMVRNVIDTRRLNTMDDGIPF